MSEEQSTGEAIPDAEQISPISRMLNPNLAWMHIHSQNTRQVILPSWVSNKGTKDVLCMVEILKSLQHLQKGFGSTGLDCPPEFQIIS